MPVTPHRLLLRQLQRLGLRADHLPGDAVQWVALVDQVSRAYTEADQRRHLLECSRVTASREMQGLHERIQLVQRSAGLGHWCYDRDDLLRQWSPECFRIFGFDPGGLAPSTVEFEHWIDPRDRPLVAAVSKAAWRDGQPFDMEFRMVLPDGNRRWVHVTGQPLEPSAHPIEHMHGTVRDITPSKRVQTRQAIEHGVSRVLNQAEDTLQAVGGVVQTLCENLGWACGGLWLAERGSQLLQRAASWSNEGSARWFYRLGAQAVPMDDSLPMLWRAFTEAQPMWLADVTGEVSFGRKDAARVAGLHAALAFPVQVDGEVFGVMELLATHAELADAELLQSAESIGRQVGQFLHRKRAEASLRESEAHFRALVEQAADSFFVHDSDGRIVDVNQRGCDTLQYARGELLQLSLADIALDLSFADLRSGEPGAAPLSLERRYRRKNGSTLPVEISVGPMVVGGRQHLLLLVRDISERQRLEQHVRQLAFHDPLTGLPNRTTFGRDLTQAVMRAAQRGGSLAMLFIDLDRFKNINDTLGHDAGDRLLQELGRRLQGCLRQGDLVARLGGDEFVVLLEAMDDPAEVGGVARKILAALLREACLDGQAVNMTASIGISLYPQDATDEKVLMRYADIAMYRAKEQGKNGYQFFCAKMNRHSSQRLALESRLRRAIERGELVLHYQPKVDLLGGRIAGAEALVRWQHPELGMLPPNQFIPLAEESGLIAPMGLWVLNEACRQNSAWQAAGLAPLRIAVNLSPRQFADDRLLLDIASALERSGMAAHWLELEITESMVMTDPEHTLQVLAGLRAMGVTIAIDDFGIGHSSLSHLKRFQFDVLKIDQSFVTGVADDPACAAITRAVIAMSSSLGLTTVAEGVETAAQLAFLQQHRCDQVQGYLFSRPVPAEAFAALLAAGVVGSSVRLSA